MYNVDELRMSSSIGVSARICIHTLVYDIASYILNSPHGGGGKGRWCGDAVCGSGQTLCITVEENVAISWGSSAF